MATAFDSLFPAEVHMAYRKPPEQYPEPTEHSPGNGSRTKYVSGCRCHECVVHNRVYQLDWFRKNASALARKTREAASA